jgi:hypothetical protein
MSWQIGDWAFRVLGEEPDLIEHFCCGEWLGENETGGLEGKSSELLSSEE